MDNHIHVVEKSESYNAFIARIISLASQIKEKIVEVHLIRFEQFEITPMVPDVADHLLTVSGMFCWGTVKLIR